MLTNVTQDHLDYHRTMDAYFEAKASLFEPGRLEVAVVNRDDPWGRTPARAAPGRGPAGGDVWPRRTLHGLELGPAGSRFGWDGAHGEAHPRRSVQRAQRPGRRHHRSGARASPPATIAAGLGRSARVPGRFERVDAGQPFTVVVDYAHTPDGLDKALRVGPGADRRAG